jgi:hypothetical protein
MHKLSIYLYMMQESCINNATLSTPEDDSELIIRQKLEGIGYEF